MPGTRAAVMWCTAAALSSTMLRCSSSGSRSKRPNMPTPAFSHGPPTWRSPFSSRLISSVRARSVPRSASIVAAPDSPPSSDWRSTRRSRRRATSVTWWPRRASSRASSPPIPDEAPVTTTVESGLGSGRDMSISGWSWSVAFSAAMRAWAHDRFSFPLPAGHRFPLAKYSRLRARLAVEGIVAPEEIRGSRPATWAELALVHDHDYLLRVRRGELSMREQRGLGLPWSPALVDRGRRSTQGTVEATRDARSTGLGLNLGGGTHHAGRAAGRGFCLFNDVVLAIAVARRAGLLTRALVVDCDVHQGDGTAELLAGDPDAFALSVHSAVNYPFHRATSDLDVDLPAGTGDEAYLAALDEALDTALAAGPWDHAFFLAGADPWEGDRLGRLALTKAGLRRRDELVLDRLRDHGAPVTVVLAGGYAPDVEDTVDINTATAAAVAARVAVPV